MHPYRKENFPNENFSTVEVSRCLSSFKRYCQSKFATNLNYNICLDFHLHQFQNADYVVYPRSAQAYADARTSTWVNQKGYTTFA